MKLYKNILFSVALLLPTLSSAAWISFEDNHSYNEIQESTSVSRQIRVDFSTNKIDNEGMSIRFEDLGNKIKYLSNEKKFERVSLYFYIENNDHYNKATLILDQVDVDAVCYQNISSLNILENNLIFLESSWNDFLK